MNKKEKISIIIPCYNSEITIESVVADCLIAMKQRDYLYEILLINDGSIDNTWNIISKLAKKKNIIGINFTKNFGQHAAIMAGLRMSKGNIAVIMDDDGQTDPKQIWKLIDEINKGYDVVFAKYSNLQENVFRKLGSLLNRKMAEVLINKPKSINGTSYMAIRRYVVEDIVKYDKSYPYLGGLIYRATKNISEVEIEHKKRKNGSSGYTLKKLINLLMNGFTAFSVKPLRVATYLGFIVAIIGFVYGIIIIVRRLTNSIVELGYSSIMASLLFIGGIIMILLGLIGEYIGRIYISINNSPQYVIKEKTK